MNWLKLAQTLIPIAIQIADKWRFIARWRNLTDNLHGGEWELRDSRLRSKQCQLHNRPDKYHSGADINIAMQAAVQLDRQRQFGSNACWHNASGSLFGRQFRDEPCPPSTDGIRIGR